ncbi:MAG: hypothetical protein OEZ25_07920 [Candidatus Bathyarchaeota archaeon]|nr:hypothetical protein [Candidatus Bathyarchaeota archaeon]
MKPCDDVFPSIYSLRDLKDAVLAIDKIAKGIKDTERGKIFEPIEKGTKEKVGETKRKAIFRLFTILGLLDKKATPSRGAARHYIYYPTPLLSNLYESIKTKIGEEPSDEEKEAFRDLLKKYLPAWRTLAFFERRPGEKDLESLATAIFQGHLENYKISTLVDRSYALTLFLKDLELLSDDLRPTTLGRRWAFTPGKVVELVVGSLKGLGYTVRQSESTEHVVEWETVYRVPVIGEVQVFFLYALSREDAEVKIEEIKQRVGANLAAIVLIIPGIKRSYTTRIETDRGIISLFMRDVNALLANYNLGQPLPRLDEAIRESLQFGIGKVLGGLEGARDYSNISEIVRKTELEKTFLKEELVLANNLGLADWHIKAKSKEDMFRLEKKGKEVLKHLRDLSRLICGTKDESTEHYAL